MFLSKILINTFMYDYILRRGRKYFPRSCWQALRI